MRTEQESLPLNRESQSAAILSHLQSGKTLTPIESLRLFGSFRLSGRVYDLKAQGHNIKSEMVEVSEGKRVARYFIPADEPLIARNGKPKEKKIGLTRLRSLAKEIAGGDLLTELAYSKLLVAAERG